MAFAETRTRPKTKSPAKVEPDWNGFLAELTLLCERYGIGFTGETTPFVMESDDYGADYTIGDDGRLRR
jgi:hypothetical protein